MAKGSVKARSCGFIVLVALLVCSPITWGYAADAPYPTLDEAPEKFKQDLEKWQHSEDAKRKARMDAARAVQTVRFKARPEQLKDPKRCDKLLVEIGKNSHGIFPYTQDSWDMMVACQDVTGITTENKRVRAADCASGNPDGPCAMGARMMEESRQKLEKDLGELQRSVDEDNQREHARIDKDYEEDNARITEETFRNMDEDRKIQNLRSEFQEKLKEQQLNKGEDELDDEDDERREGIREGTRQ